MDLPHFKGLRKGLIPKPIQTSKGNTPQTTSREDDRLPLPRFHVKAKPVTPKAEEVHHLSQNQQLDESLYIGFETRSAWKDKVKVIQQRPSGWLNRFSEDIDEIIISPPIMTNSALKAKRIADSGWIKL